MYFQFIIGDRGLREFDYADDCFTSRAKVRFLVVEGLWKHSSIPCLLD